ncbi:MAG: DUF4412 domain-containing protein [Gemmatimonadaceae bacterium]
MNVLKVSMAAAALLVATGAAPSRAPIAEGWKFTWKVTRAESDAKRSPEAGGAQPSMAVQIAGGKIRMDFIPEPGQRSTMPKGGYWILDADASTMTIVDPSEKKAMVMDPTGMTSALGAIGKSGMMKMEFNNPEVKVEDLGAGERILGRSTHHYRITRSYDVAVQVMMMHKKSHHLSVSDTYLTNEFVDDKAFQAFAKRFSSNLQGSGEGFQKLMEAEKNVPRGFPMKVTTTNTDTDDKGQATTSTVTMEVQELSRANIDASVFEVPSGYEVVDMRQQMADLQKKMDEEKMKEGNEKAKDEAADTTKKESAIKKGLSGFLKKKKP